jgi:hypothetical protein
MDLWVSESRPGMQTTASVASSTVGLVLAIGFRDFRSAGSNATAGFFLGILLLVIGVAGLLTSGRQKVIVDPRTRYISIEDSYLLGTKSRLISFSDIVSISIGYLGKRSNYVTWYHLVLKLRSGEDYPLFSPGRFFEGGSDRSTVESWQRRLEDYLVAGQ